MELTTEQIKYLKEVKLKLGRRSDPTNFEVDLYHFLSKLFEKKVNHNEGEVKVTFDDTLYLIEFDEKEFKFVPSDYTDTILSILTEEQLGKYFSNDPERVFYISRNILEKYF